MPSTTLTAAGSARKIDLRALPSPSLFVFHGENNTDIVAEVNAALRGEFPDAAQLLIASVVDLHHIPRVFRSMANRAMNQAYTRSAELIPSELDPVQYVVILPDWDGSAAKSAGFDAVGENAGIAVADVDGNLHRALQGKEAIEQALTWVRELVG